MEKQGTINSFQYTYELEWNTVKDFYVYQGEASIQGSRGTIKSAFQRGLLKKGDI